MSDLTGSDWLDQPVRITRDGVFFGEHQLPGAIAENGVTVRASINGTDFNKLTVEFLVGEVHVDDATVAPVDTDGDTTTYGTRHA